ncbi:adenosine receptor A2b-like [Sinocyclocheilus grahami]|uniref:Adenosine receptor A2 n=1 Tax=Sinocyclocheilus grahami TaxID=75366 RepID=A0A672R6Q1_SINGR|nr:PREDICTED: adenosine receptor A2b-like [Sinocyclocheilus grahami]
MLNKDFDVLYMILELLIALLSILGNVLVCWAVGLNSNLQSITNFFVVSLAVADIAVGVLAIPFSILISTGFCANFYGCLFIACFVLVLTQSSIFSLLAIAIDRFIAIKIPLRYNSLVTGQRARGIIAICWVLSVIIGLTPMLGWHKARSKEALNSTCLPGMMKCLFEEVVVMDYMVYFNFFACVLLPLLLMLAIYLRIFMAARHQLKCIESKAVPCELKSRSTLQKEVHAAKSLAIIVGLFAVCWLPLHIINCFTLFCPQCKRPPVLIMYLAIILSHANSVVNPFIYAYRIREFRYTFRKIVRYHILGRREPLPCNGSTRTSARTSVSDSLRFKVNGLVRDLYTEQSSTTSSCESAEPGHMHRPVTTEKPILDNQPMELTNSHRHPGLRHPESPLTGNNEGVACRKHAVFDITDGKDPSSPLHVKSALYLQTAHCVELTEAS